MIKPYILLATFMAVFLILATAVYAEQNYKNMKTYKSQSIQLAEQVDKNNAKIKQLNSDIEYQGSKEFVEKIAREKLGFVMKDEIVFQIKDN